MSILLTALGATLGVIVIVLSAYPLCRTLDNIFEDRFSSDAAATSCFVLALSIFIFAFMLVVLAGAEYFPL
ncbi:hypothetical protein VPHD480_0087 [Vibrio phage D480]